MHPNGAARGGARNNPAPRFARGGEGATGFAAAEAAAITISRGASIL